MLPIYAWVCNLPLECGRCTRDHTPKGHINHQHWVRWGGTLRSSPHMLGFDLAFTSPGLAHVVINTMSSYVQMPCRVLKTLFTCSCAAPLFLTLFLSPLPQCSLIEIQMQSLILCTWVSCMSLC